MGFMEKLFGGKSAAITSQMIRDEIIRTEEELGALRTKLGSAMSGIAAMSDAEHVAEETRLAATERTIKRLEARSAYLTEELPKVIAAEEVAAKVAFDDALRQRAQALHRANTKEAAKLLAEYDVHAAKIGDILGRLKQIADETNAVNRDLVRNPVAERVTLYDDVHRKAADQPEVEHREMREVWVYPNGETTPATKDAGGRIVPEQPSWDYATQKYMGASLERREVVVGKTHFRAGKYESPLSDIILPPGFLGGATHRWPSES